VLAEALLRQDQPQKVLDELSKTKGGPSADGLALKGAALQALRRHDEAAAAFEQALAMSPGHPVALLGQARAALFKNDVPGARKLIDEALAKHPDNVDVLLFKGDLERRLVETDAALASYDKVLAVAPGNSVAHMQKTFTLIEANRYDAAQAQLTAAVKTVPDALMLNYAKALLNFKLGKFDVANDSLQQVLRVAPDYQPAILLSGAVQFALGSLPQAEQNLQSYLKNDPTNLYARKMLATTQLRSGDAGAALSTLGPALSDANDSSDFQLLGIAGEAAMRLGDFGKATSYFEKASTLSPKTAALHTALGMSSIDLGQKQRGLAELELATKQDDANLASGVALVIGAVRLHQLDKASEAVLALEKKQPDNALIQNLKGLVYMGRNEVPAARASFDKALKLSPAYFAPVLNQVKLDYAQNKPQDAQQRLEAFLKANPKSVEALTAMAEHMVRQGKPNEATQLLTRAASEDQKTPAASLRLVMHYARTKQNAEALTVLRKVQTQFPDSPEVLDMLGQLQSATGDRPGALESYGKLAAARPHSAQAQYRLAQATAAMGNGASAADALNKALQLQPDYPEAQIALGELLVSQGNGDKALAMARTLQRQQPKQPAGYVLEGDAQLQLRQPALAVQAYDKALSISPATGIMLKLNRAMNLAGKGKQAAARLAEWRKRYPDDMQALMLEGETAIASAQYPAAASVFETVLKRAPNNVVALNNLAWTYFQMHDARALATAEQAYKAAPADPTVMDTLGWILVEQNNSARGVPLLRKAAQIAPDAADVRLHLARALMKINDRTGARKELEALVNAGQGAPQADEARTLLKQL
jgi:putative PEP-CTERM system TPR-repeat lipoprotein